MITRIVRTLLPVVCALSCQLQPCLAADNYLDDKTPGQGLGDSQADAKLFQLKAQMLDYKKMSRSELDVARPVAASNTLAQPARSTGSSSHIALAGAAPTMALALPMQGRVSAQANRQELKPAQPEPDNGFLHEYNVDWSHWMAAVADRWWYVLQVAEQTFSCEFVTVRPALVQFTCWRNGQISNISLKQSSGNPVYDQLQMVALINAAPLPPFPAGTKRTSITLVQGWESHLKREGETGYVPGSFGKGFPAEKVREWVKGR